MKYLLAVMLLFYGLTYWTYRSADRPGDDFGAGVMVWVCGAVSVVLTIAYLVAALWLKRLV